MTLVQGAPGIVRSSLLDAVPGLVHGFTTRELGSMAGSLSGAEEQERNRAALERTIGLPIVKASQVHGNDVVLLASGRATRVRDGESRPVEHASELEADALISRERGLALAVAVADCVPVLAVTPDGWIGIAHAGWEGTTRDVVGLMTAAIAEQGAARSDWRIAIGPSIGPCCYEIDAARATEVRERLGRRADRVLRPRGDRYDLDLWLAIRLRLRDAGMDVVDSLDVCAKDEVARFFSHRGEQRRAGRGLAFIGWQRGVPTLGRHDGARGEMREGSR